MIPSSHHARNDAQPRDRSARVWPAERLIGGPRVAAPGTFDGFMTMPHGAQGSLGARGLAPTSETCQDVIPYGSPASRN